MSPRLVVRVLRSFQRPLQPSTQFIIVNEPPMLKNNAFSVFAVYVVLYVSLRSS